MMIEGYDISYTVWFPSEPNSQEYLTTIACDTQDAVRHLVKQASDLGASLEPDEIYVEGVNRFVSEGRAVEGARTCIEKGFHLRAHVIKSNKR